MTNQAYEATNSDVRLIAATKSAAKKATPGQWQAFIDKASSTYSVFAKNIDDVISWMGFEGRKNAGNNAIFIAIANPENVLKLIAALEQEEAYRKSAFVTANLWRDKFVAAEQRIEQLEAAPSDMMQLSNELAEVKRKCVGVPDEFARIAENLRSQDNRVTSDPMFCVFQKREIVTDEDYDHDRIVWIDEDGNEATAHQRKRLELLHENSREAPEKWRRIAVKEITDFVTCCFTEQGCKDYLACNGHNLRLPFIYVKSGFRNAEYQTMRNWLMKVGTVEGSE